MRIVFEALRSLCIVALLSVILLSAWMVLSPIEGDIEYNYNRITSGMCFAQVTDIIGEGEILRYIHNRAVEMKYTGEGIEMQLIFIDGIVYQKTLTLSEIEQ